jgi:dihydrolipoamide dehydrogenase
LETESDTVVVGGGVAGIAAAIRAAQLGLKVALVEKATIGGMHATWGGIASKAMIDAVHLFRRVRDGDGMGIEGSASLSWKKMQQHRDRACAQVSKFNEVALSRNGVRVLHGICKLLSPTKLEISLASSRTEGISAENVIVATGSSPSTIPRVPLGGPIVDSEGALRLDSPPASLLIVGGGAVGVELATIFRLSGSKVTLVEMMPTLLPGEEPEAGDFVARSLQKEGVQVLVGSRVIGTETTGSDVNAELDTPQGRTAVTAEKVLMAVGRQPNIDADALAVAGVKTTRRGIVVNSRMQTTAPSIYAAGDVVDALGRQQLVNVAIREGKVAAENVAGGNKIMNYDIVPRCVFTIPEVASIGLTEHQAQEKGLKTTVTKASYYCPRGGASGETEGIIKIITDSDERIIGGVIVGANASELISQLAMAMTKGTKPREIAEMMYPSPSFSEVVWNTMSMVGEEQTFGLTKPRGK